MGLAFIPYYIRYLGIEAYGLIGLFAALQAWLTILDLGMTPTLGREMARFTGGEHTAESIRTLLRSIEALALLLGLFIAASVYFASGWIATSWLQTQDLDPAVVAAAIGLMGLVIALRFIEGLYRSAVVGLERQVAYNLVTALMATLRAGGAVGVLVWISPSILAFFLWQGTVSILTVGILARLTYRILPATGQVARPSLAALRPVYKFAGGMVGVSILSALLMQIDKILLSRLLPLSEFGQYTLAATAAGALYFLISPISQAYFPRLCAQLAANDSEGFIRSYHMAAQSISVIAGSAAIVVIFFSERLVRLWTGDATLAAQVAPILSILAFGNLLNGLMYAPFLAQVAHGWTSLTNRINLFAVFLIIPALIWTVPHFGAMGAAVVWVCLNTGYVLIGVRLMHRRLMPGELSVWNKDDVSKPLLAGMAAALLTALATQGLGPNWLSDGFCLAVGSLSVIAASISSSSRLRAIALQRPLLFRPSEP